MRSLLKGRGMEISTSYLVCDLKDEMIDHAILSCPRTRLIWRCAGDHPWEMNCKPWWEPFLDRIHRSSEEERIGIWRARLAYITYQIWLFKYNLVFDVEVAPMHMGKALCLYMKYNYFDTVDWPLDAPKHYDSLAAMAVIHKVVFIS